MGLLKETDRITSVPRLSDVLFERSRRTFGSLAALPTNVEAIEAALLFSAGMHTLVSLVGPSGWGNSHPMEGGAHRFSQEPGEPPEVRTAADYLLGANRPDPATLILDD